MVCPVLPYCMGLFFKYRFLALLPLHLPVNSARVVSARRPDVHRAAPLAGRLAVIKMCEVEGLAPDRPGSNVNFTQGGETVKSDGAVTRRIGARAQDFDFIAGLQGERQLIVGVLIKHVGFVTRRPGDDDRA